MIEFKDRVAIVTGAGRGLGAEHAKLLAARTKLGLPGAADPLTVAHATVSYTQECLLSASDQAERMSS